MTRRKLSLTNLSKSNPSVRLSEDLLDNFTFNNFFQTFEDFLSLKQIEGLAPRSLKDYRNHMNYFNQFVQDSQWTIDIRCVDIESFRSYIFYMVQEKQYKPCTINIRLRTLKAYLRWLYKENYIDEDISLRIKLVKEPTDTIKPLSDTDIKKLLNSPDKLTYVGLRDFTLMVLMLDCGIRVGEAVSLKINDIDVKSRFLNIPAEVAKTRVFRQVPLSAKTIKLLKQLIPIVSESDSDYMFQSAYGNKLSSDQVIHNFTNYGKKVNIKCKCSPHVFRHTFAVNFIKNNGDVFTLQRILGHTTLEMTRRYINLSSSDLTKKHSIVSPLDKYLK